MEVRIDKPPVVSDNLLYRDKQRACQGFGIISLKGHYYILKIDVFSLTL